MVSPEKEKDLRERMQRLGLHDADLEEKFVLGSGPGGQKVNKSHTTVYLKHAKTGFEVKCQETRSQAMNRFLARRLLVEKLEKHLLQIKSKKDQEISRIRRQKKRRSRKQKEKMLEKKHHRGEIKKMRGKIRGQGD